MLKYILIAATVFALVLAGVVFYIIYKASAPVPGVEFSLQIENYQTLEQTLTEKELEDYRTQTIDILRKRLNRNNLKRVSVTTPEPDMIVIQVAADSDDKKEEIAKLLEWKRCQLSFRLVHENNAPLIAQVAEMHNGELPLKSDAKISKICPAGYEYMTIVESEAKQTYIQGYFVKIRPEMDGKDIAAAHTERNEYIHSRYDIRIRFSKKGKADFARLTERNVGRQLAIVLDGKLILAPTIQTPITGGSAEISGDFSQDQANEIADALEAGSVPFAISIKSQRNIIVK